MRTRFYNAKGEPVRTEEEATYYCARYDGERYPWELGYLDHTNSWPLMSSGKTPGGTFRTLPEAVTVLQAWIASR